MHRFIWDIYYDTDVKSYIPKLLSRFISNVIGAVLKSDSFDLSDFKITINKPTYFVCVDSTKDFKYVIDDFNMNRLLDLASEDNTFGIGYEYGLIDYRYYETDEDEEIPTGINARYNLDMKGLKTRKILSKLISDFIISTCNIFLCEESWEFRDFEITVDFHKSLLSLESKYDFHKFISRFNNNGFPCEYTCNIGE